MKMMLKFSILQIFNINIGKHFCMNTSISGTQLTTNAVTCENAKSS